MNFLHKVLELAEGDVVEVYLTAPANVQLLDQANYELYGNKQPYRYYGGYAPESPAQVAAPSAGSWHMVIDLPGAGRVQASYRVLAATTA